MLQGQGLGQVSALSAGGAVGVGGMTAYATGLQGQGLAQGQELAQAQGQGLAQAQGQGLAMAASSTSSVGGMFTSFFGSSSSAVDKVPKGKGNDGVDMGLGLGSGLATGSGLGLGSALGGSLGGLGSLGSGLGQGLGQGPSVASNSNGVSTEMPTALSTAGTGVTGSSIPTASLMGKQHVHGENHKDKATAAAANGLGLGGLAADVTTGNTPFPYTQK